MTIGQETGLTRKQLASITKCRPYLIDYYRTCGYLKIVKQSTGPGDKVLFDPESIEIVKARMARRNPVIEGHTNDPR